MTTLSGARSGRARPTMRDVAARAGVSLKTVSRVVNDEPGVSPAMTERVQQAARELGFRLNLGARSLRRSDGRTGTIGLLLADVANPFCSVLHRSIEDLARSRGVAVIAGSLDEQPERERELVSAFTSRRVDGLIMMPTAADQDYLLHERDAGTAMVFVDRPPGLAEADVVLADNRGGAETGVGHLIARGHRHIAFLGDSVRIATAQLRFGGYLDALRLAGVPFAGQHAIHDVGSVQAAADATVTLLRGRDAPTALFTAQNLVTIGALQALRGLGLQRQVALVGFDDFLLADLLDPPVTVVAQDPQRMGVLAAERLFARADGDTAPFVTEVVPTQLVTRGSGELAPPAMS